MTSSALEQRRHQRIRFASPPSLQIGFGGRLVEGWLENLSLSGLMMRVDLPLEVGRMAGCEFSLFGSPLIDVPVTIASRIGDLFGARFQCGPINQVIIDDAMTSALVRGKASTLTVHELAGRKVMRIAGGLNASLRNDFMHALSRVGVDEIDVSGVTVVDPLGMVLCQEAVRRHGVALGAQSSCFAEAWRLAP